MLMVSGLWVWFEVLGGLGFGMRVVEFRTVVF